MNKQEQEVTNKLTHLKNNMAKSEGLGSLFGEQPKEEQTNLPALLFKARNDAHITHLLNRDGTLATHKALQKFYEELIDLIDGFIETSLILYPVADICVEESCCIADPKAYFKDLYSYCLNRCYDINSYCIFTIQY